MQGGYYQAGGFDPGLAALIASIVTGGVGAYGYSKADSAKQEEALKTALGADWKEQIAASEKLRAEKKTDEATIQRLEATVAELTAKNKQIATSAAAASGPALAFKSATPEVLTAAADALLQSMAAKYSWVSNAPMLKAALLYPTTYQGRLARMSLPDFYEKRIKPSAQQDYEAAPKGGRKRRRARRGGVTEAERDALDAQPPDFSAEDKAKTEQFLNEDEAPAPAAAPAAPAAPTAPGFPFPSYEEFAQLYAEAITSVQQSAAKGVVSARAAEDARSTAARAAVDAKVQKKADKAATKAIKKADAAAKTLAEKYALDIGGAVLDATRDIKPYVELHQTLDTERKQTLDTVAKRVTDLITVGKSYIPIEAYEVLLQKTIDEEDKEDVESVLTSLLGAVARVERMENAALGGAWPFSKAKPDTTPVDTTPLPTTYDAIMKSETPNTLLTPEVKDRLSKLKPMLQTAVKDYIQAVKDAEKAEIKELTDIGSRSLFKITVPMPSPSNPFAGLWKKLTTESKSYTDSQAAAIIREETKKKVVFIKTIFKSVDLILKELEKKQMRTKGGRRRKARSGGNPLASETADDQCAELRKKPEFANGDPTYLRDSIRAIAYGSVNEVDGTEWVARKASSPTQKSSLKYLLDRLNTGAFAETADYLKGLRGKDVTYTLDDVILAGEAYVLLRCYLKKAAGIVKDLRVSETVFQDLKMSREASAAKATESSERRSAVDSAKRTAELDIENATTALSDRQAKVQDVSAMVLSEMGRRPPRMDVDPNTSAMAGVRNSLERASKALYDFQASDIHQKFISSGDLFEGYSTADVTSVTSEFDRRKAAYTAEADTVYAGVDKILEETAQFARTLTKTAPDLAEKIMERTGVSLGPVEARSFTGKNPIQKVKRSAAPELPATPVLLPPPENAARETSTSATSEPGSTGTAPTTPVADGPPGPGIEMTPLSLYQPNPLRDPNQVSASTASQRFMLPGTKGKTGLKVSKTPSATVTVRKGGRTARKSTLKKRRGGK
jgi:hypothetical protein